MSCQLEIFFLLAFVQQDEDEIEAGEQSCREVDILLRCFSRVVSEWGKDYLLYRGLAAARTEVRALSVVVMPAFAMETVCCSITS